ncbi:MarR family winged helix-turn-helix transcriptional regulator [uncultured Flavonifractor sp.]|uniref:MarR family winged helix-turn-helix transcriptional regulator n=1 Tax=uncultured Flavonifractor sp. TaxID=1193534 RepID=UPI00262435F7|nr:MarR family winged helix-turn-helix transcriptional regulator [uncultured Flavonifractor sp.]
MHHEHHVGYEIKALSNLLRRKVLESTETPDGDDFTEMSAKILGFLYQNRDQKVYQKDVEEAFYIRRSTTSRLLKRMEAEGLVIRQAVAHDARLKQVLATPKAEALVQEIMKRIDNVEQLLTQGLSPQEVEQFLATVEKLKRNLM